MYYELRSLVICAHLFNYMSVSEVRQRCCLCSEVQSVFQFIVKLFSGVEIKVAYSSSSFPSSANLCVLMDPTVCKSMFALVPLDP